MKRPKLYIMLSTFILSVAALIVTKANTKLAPFGKACFAGLAMSQITANGRFTSVKGAGAKTFGVYTGSGVFGTTNHTAVTCTNRIVQLYLKP